jgi:hypothetical protein
MICIVRDEFNKSIHISIHYQLSITGIEPQVIAGICGLITTQDLDLIKKRKQYTTSLSDLFQIFVSLGFDKNGFTKYIYLVQR